MTYPVWQAEKLARQRSQELLQEAEQHRLVKEALINNPQPSLLSRLVNWLKKTPSSAPMRETTHPIDTSMKDCATC